MKKQILFSSLLLLGVLANQQQSYAQPKNTLENLPDGYYFYGEPSTPNQFGGSYFWLKKTEKQVIGEAFFYRSYSAGCFRGKVDKNLLVDVTIGEYEPEIEGGKWRFTKVDQINLGKFNQFQWSQVPQDTKPVESINKCVQVFENKS